MDRRNFLSGSLSASALSLATAGESTCSSGLCCGQICAGVYGSAPVPSDKWTGRKTH